MSNIELGKLYQYKDTHAGLLFRNKPTVPYSDAYERISLQSKISNDRKPGAVPWEKEFYFLATTKIMVLPCRFDVVTHRSFKSLKETYVYATFSREKDWIMGWVRESWLEPLQDLDDTYEESARKRVREQALSIVEKMREKGKELASQPNTSPHDALMKIMERRAKTTPAKK